ncbi:hypothetical protein D3C85_1532660 [compost metagenome]
MGIFRNNIFIGIIESNNPSQFVLDYWRNKGRAYKMRLITAEDRANMAQGFKVKF